VVANPSRIKSDLGWQSLYDLDSTIRSAWDAWQVSTKEKSEVLMRR
jgi:UDP-glucose 4-epimerase